MNHFLEDRLVLLLDDPARRGARHFQALQSLPGASANTGGCAVGVPAASRDAQPVGVPGFRTTWLWLRGSQPSGFGVRVGCCVGCCARQALATPSTTEVRPLEKRFENPQALDIHRRASMSVAERNIARARCEDREPAPGQTNARDVSSPVPAGRGRRRVRGLVDGRMTCPASGSAG
jgi:hypothetical protein